MFCFVRYILIFIFFFYRCSFISLSLYFVSGAFSVVRLGEDKETGDQVAIKVVEKKNVSEKFMKNLNREIEIMKKVDHPNIVKLIDLFDVGDKFYFVMEIVTGGELFDRIVEKGSYSEHDAKTLVKRILRGIAYLHADGIAHRDLKPENLLLKSKDNDYDVKIADFGLSSFISDNALMQTACGTPAYVAPEVLLNTGYDQEVDLWSIGVITYILLVGFPPFHGETVRQILEVVSKGRYDFPSPYWDDISPHARDFIRKLLVVDPKKRMSAKEALDHVWIRSTGSKIQLANFREQMSKYVSQRKEDERRRAGPEKH